MWKSFCIQTFLFGIFFVMNLFAESESLDSNFESEFETFLNSFVPLAAAKEKELMLANWELETAASPQAAEKRVQCDLAFRALFSDATIYDKLKKWEKEGANFSDALKRQLQVLLREFKKHSIPVPLQKTIAAKEADLALSYSNFRADLNGCKVSENEILDILKTESDPAKRQKAWEASKMIGNIWAPQILELVALRNEAAHALGYANYFEMELDLQEIDEAWLLNTFQDLQSQSEMAYLKLIQEIEQAQCKRFEVEANALGPWAWSDPFGQEDPIDRSELEKLVQDIDICDKSLKFYDQLGYDVEPVLQKSDMWERPGKNQHAFCLNIDRGNDVRTLNNVKNSMRWLETVLHELGHAIYELGFDPELPWILRQPAHTLTTEAMALIAGRQAYYPETLSVLANCDRMDPLMTKAKESLKRRQLIFSRWVFVMTHFERELYQNPNQDLNALWWEIVQKYQKIPMPAGREGLNDWACKFHIGLGPVYYFSYLLGEMLASTIEDSLTNELGSPFLSSPEAGAWLKLKLFAPGNKMPWTELVEQATGESLNSRAWVNQFAK